MFTNETGSTGSTSSRRRGRAPKRGSSTGSSVAPASSVEEVRADSIARVSERIGRLKFEDYKATELPPPITRIASPSPVSRTPRATRAVDVPTRTLDSAGRVSSPPRNSSTDAVRSLRDATREPAKPRDEVRVEEEVRAPEDAFAPRRSRLNVVPVVNAQPETKNRTPRPSRWGVPSAYQERRGREMPQTSEYDIPRLRRHGDISPPRAQGDLSAYYASLSESEEIDTRKKFNDRFLVLQRRFPKWNIPLPAPNANLAYVHTLYESYVKQVSAHQNAENFRIFLILMFVGIEFGAARSGVDLSGYARYQMDNMDLYNGALLELGVKYSSTSESEWPVEARIVFLALIQAGIFFAAKYIERLLNIPAEKTQTTLSGMFGFRAQEEPETGKPKGTDALGCPIPPGAEEDIEALDSGKPVPKAAPTGDLSGLLGGLMGGGGLDMSSLISTAAKFMAPQAKPVGRASQPAATPKTPGVPSPRSPRCPRRPPAYNTD